MATYRQLSSDDIEHLREIDVSERGKIIYTYADGHLSTTSEAWQRPRWSEEECKRRINDLRADLAAGDIALGAFDGKTLVGLATVRPHLDPGRTQLAGLWVSRSHRRKGVASRFAEMVDRIAREAGSSQLYVSATPSQSAVGFYESRGFTPTTNISHDLFELEPEDIHMTLNLD